MDITVKIKYLSDKFKNEKIKNDENSGEIHKPFYATPGSAAMDLSACIDEDIHLKKGESALIPTGIAISLPSPEYVALVCARSGLAIKHGITLTNSVGVIDSDYRGEIKCGIINLGKNDYTIKCGERIAQLMFLPIVRPILEETDELDDTNRGEGGFGSTGKS